MAKLSLPKDELNSFDLPSICVVTGQTEGVTFRKVKFSWYPRWINLFAVVALFIMAILSLVLRKYAKGELPFTDEGWKRWKSAQVSLGLSVVGCMLTFFLGVGVFSNRSTELGMMLFLLSVGLPVGVWLGYAKSRSLRVLKIDDTHLFLDIPSDEAAFRIQQHLKGGDAVRADARAAG